MLLLYSLRAFVLFKLKLFATNFVAIFRPKKRLFSLIFLLLSLRANYSAISVLKQFSHL